MAERPYQGAYGIDLMEAIMVRDDKKVHRLLKNGASLNAKTKGDYAIHLAARFGQMKYIRYLLRAGEDVNKQNEHGNTALHLVCRDGNEVIVNYLVKKGADINIKNMDGDAPLHFCVTHQPLDIIERFVNIGMEVNAQNIFGETPLHHAVAHSREEAVEALLLCDADPTIKNNRGRRPDQEAKIPGLGEQIRTYRLLAAAKESGYIHARGMKIAHTDVDKYHEIHRVGIMIESMELPTDFPTTFYCRREKAEISSVKLPTDSEEEIVSDVFLLRVSHVYHDVTASLALPVYAQPSDNEEIVVRFVLGNGELKTLKDYKENEETIYYHIDVVLVPDTTTACIICIRPLAEESHVGNQAQVVTSEVDPDFRLDIPEGTFAEGSVLSLRVFHDADDDESEDIDNKTQDNKHPNSQYDRPNRISVESDLQMEDLEEHTQGENNRMVANEGDQMDKNEDKPTKPEKAQSKRKHSEELQDELSDGTKKKQQHTDETESDLKTIEGLKSENSCSPLLSDVYEINITGPQPNKLVKMQLPLKQAFGDFSEGVDIVAIGDIYNKDSTVEVFPAGKISEDGTVTFEISHFSMYQAIPHNCQMDYEKILQRIVNTKESKRPARFFSLLQPTADGAADEFLLVVECIRDQHCRRRRDRWENKGFLVQRPKHSHQMKLKPSQEFIVRLEGDVQFDTDNGETGIRRLMFSPHRASFQLYLIKLKHGKTGKGRVHIHPMTHTAASSNTENAGVVETEAIEKPLLTLKLKLPLPPSPPDEESSLSLMAEIQPAAGSSVDEPAMSLLPEVEPATPSLPESLPAEEIEPDSDCDSLRELLQPLAINLPRRPKSAIEGRRYRPPPGEAIVETLYSREPLRK